MSRRITAEEWRPYRSIIEGLYQTHTLEQIRRYMIENHGFNANTQQYERAVRNWGFRKKKSRTLEQWRGLPGHIQERVPPYQISHGSSSCPSSDDSNEALKDLTGSICNPVSASRSLEEIKSQLRDAIRDRDLARMRDLLDEAEGQEASAQIKANCLLQAANCNGVEAVEELIKHGVDISQSALFEYGPLQAAAYRGHTEVVEVLLEHGANTEELARAAFWFSEVEPERTALHWACIEGETDVVEVLLENMAKVDAETPIFAEYRGCTPLHLAIIQGHIYTVQTLLDHQADIDRLCQVGNRLINAIDLACESGHIYILEVLLQNKFSNMVHHRDAARWDLQEATYFWLEKINIIIAIMMNKALERCKKDLTNLQKQMI